MQALRNTLKQIGDSLSRLPTNAKLLIGSMAVILLMVLFFVSQYTGKRDMAPLGLPATADVRARVVRHLDMSFVDYEDRGDDIYVPLGQRYRVLGELSQQQVVAADQIDFNALIDLQTNPFISGAQARQMWLTAKMNVLSAMITARQDVSTARVIIDQPPGQPGIGQAYVPPTASVVVSMQGATMSQDVADVIGHTVAAAHAGLKPENVMVMEVGSSKRFKPRGNDSLSTGSYLEHKKSTEEHYRRMIEDALAHIPGASVTVNAVIKNTLEERSERRIDDPKIGPVRTESREFESNSGGSAAEPGARSNVGARIAGGSRTAQVTENETTDEKDSRFGGQDRVVRDSTGYPLQVNAMVGIPKSYFVRVYRSEQGDAEAEPTLAELDPIVQAKTAEWQTFLAPLIKTQGLEDTIAGEVLVRLIHDFDQAGTSIIEASGGGAGSMLAGGGLVRSVGLGALALLSVVMMFLMVRKANVRQDLPSAAELAGIPPELKVSESDLVGEADEGEPALVGVELDDATMRAQQLLEQINSMIAEGPDEAAGLFERWVAAEPA